MAGYIEKNEFVDSKLGIIKISNICFLKKEDLIGFGWKFVSASHEDNDFDRLDGDKYKQSTYIYQNPLNPTKAIRIYEDYAEYPYVYHRDYSLILALQAKQGNIHLTQFPTGIVTIDNKIIGQQIPYYVGYLPIDKVVRQGVSEDSFYDYLRKIIAIFEELYENNVYYSDIHYGNFLVNTETGDVRLIDFEPSLVLVNVADNKREEILNNNLQRIKGLFFRLSDICGINLPNRDAEVLTISDLHSLIPSKRK